MPVPPRRRHDALHPRRAHRPARLLAATALLLAALAAALAPAASAAESTTTGSADRGAAAQPVADSTPLLPDGQDGVRVQPDTDTQTGTGTGSVTGNAPAEAGTTSWAARAGWAVLLLASAVMTFVAGTTLLWMLHAWRSTESLRTTGFAAAPVPPQRRFTVLLPARHEEQVLGHTIDRLAASDHPDLEIIVIIGHDDPGTEAVARAAEERHPTLVKVVIDHSEPKNKPRGMNTALPHVTGDVVGVFDAEDEVHPRLLSLVDARFTETGADLVQGGVQLMNVQTTWWSLRNCLEYYFWFRSRLHFHAEQHFIPLGGNTIFVRTDLLREAGGWDGDCLAEDCELGVRLSTGGATVAVAYDTDVVTREETPGSVRSLVKQRTRWSQGFLQVLGKGIWKQLPTRRQRLLARYTLAMPFLQAFTGVMIPVSIGLVLFAKVPTLVALLSFVPVVPTLVTIVVEAAGLGEFARAYGVRLRPWDYLRLVLGTFPYQVLLAFAALRAAWRELRGDSSWEKTEHTGAHVVPDAGTAPVPEVAAR
ncbi:glycosyltransferase [Nocardioides bruguierae]|uniref:Glycosyltransferase n=1 Tax=Nocardioides bruguierae TaxID=2945102 RepID=A0A9X2D887_9ACTN|nr:glycosyltransferase [Nocardioides bruguierae]MCM0620597.1 glycosyltransferase [Nocardioides bruguierae]